MDYAIESGLKKGFDKGLKEGMQKGRAEGLAEGLAEGMKQERYEIARKLLEVGIPLESIMQATGLSKDDIKQLTK